MHPTQRAPSYLLAAVLLMAAAASAQFPDKFTNLQVLPKDIPKPELMQTMRRFAFALNVRCPYCHTQKSGGQMDFSADDKETKKTARVMLQMVAAINQNYVSKITTTPAGIQVECVTCHRGVAQPVPMNKLLADAISTKGIDSATALYHDLRAKYYGTGAYDFSDVPLNQLAESLLAQDKNKEAVAIMEMNFAANNPDSMYAYHVLAMAHAANGEIDKEKADYQQVVKLHPDDDWAKKQLDALTAPK